MTTAGRAAPARTGREGRPLESQHLSDHIRLADVTHPQKADLVVVDRVVEACEAVLLSRKKVLECPGVDAGIDEAETDAPARERLASLFVGIVLRDDETEGAARSTCEKRAC